MSFCFWDGDGKARVVEDVLEGEEIAVDDKRGDATSVDCFERPSCPISAERFRSERGGRDGRREGGG